MKSIIYTLLLLFPLTMIAQPTISSDAIVDLGETEPTMFLPINEQNWVSGNAGPNQNWDYSSIGDGQACDYVAIDPATSAYYDSFPDSDLYFVCTFTDSQGFMTEDHTFYNVDNEVLQLAGNVSISISNPNYDSIFIVYTDPLDWGTFPYNYEDVTDDTFEANITSYLGNQTIFATQSGTSIHEVDSYGTLITPSGTFQNTIRVKRVELAENMIPGIPFTTGQESYRYTWYSENENGVILNLDSLVTKDFNGNVVSTNYSGSYRIAGPTMTSIGRLNDLEFSVYPNPMVNEATLNLTNIDDYTIEVVALDGKLIPLSILQIDDNQAKINFRSTSLFSGTYYLNLSNNKTQRRFSKQIIINP